MRETFVVSETINSNSKRIWGSFKLSDGTKTRFEFKKGDVNGWFQWGNFENNLCITTERVEKLCYDFAMGE